MAAEDEINKVRQPNDHENPNPVTGNPRKLNAKTSAENGVKLKASI